MMRIERINDIDTLRQVAVLLDRENRRLHERLAKLASEIDRLKGQDTSTLQRELDALKVILAHREKAIFGEKSEKRPGVGPGPGPSKSAARPRATTAAHPARCRCH